MDRIETDRFRNQEDLQGLLRQILTEGEITAHAGLSEDPARCALLLVAKEAVLRVLACGLDRGSRWREVDLTRDFRVFLSGGVRRLAGERSVKRILVSPSRAGAIAMALAIAES